VTVHPIRSIGDPVLRQRAVEVPLDQIAASETQTLIDDLIDTMRAADGAGLAANQIGALQRVAVMEVHDNLRYPYKSPIPLTIAVNPVIEAMVDAEGVPETVLINEGCLSVPLRGEVRRHVTVRVRYRDRRGIEHEQIERGLTAGTWQHECDHLDGVLFVDRVDDPATLATWDEYAFHHRAAFVERITAFEERFRS